MTTGNKEKPSGSIPIRFVDDEDQDVTEFPQGSVDFDLSEVEDVSLPLVEIDAGDNRGRVPIGGPELAELIAARSELKRLQGELAESRDAVARRQADLENYRKRVERERGEAFNRVVADVARKLLPVVDNLAPAVDAEPTGQYHESKRVKHFL